MTLRFSVIHLVVAAATLAICAATFAGGSEARKTTAKPRNIQKSSSKTCFVRFGGSAFPEPCDRLGEMPATAEPMRIIGKLPTGPDAR
jgi:hypothetical protein